MAIKDKHNPALAVWIVATQKIKSELFEAIFQKKPNQKIRFFSKFA